MFRRKQHHYLQFGPHQIHRRFGTEHFDISGAPGSGKTTQLKRLMKSSIQTLLTMRGLGYDPKREILRVLFELTGDTEEMVKSGTSRVKVLDILDQRAYAWDIGKDIDSPLSARELAAILVPESGTGHEGQSFFDSAARDIVYGVQLGLMNTASNGNSWTFGDVIRASLNETYARALFEIAESQGVPGAQEIARIRESYLDCDPRTASNIRATLSTHLSIFEPIAACWDVARKAGRTFSLSEWASDGCQEILVLGSSDEGRSSYAAMNRAIFTRAAQILLSRRETTDQERETGDNQTWIWLDELREAGNLNPGLSSLMLRGRSKGICMVLAYQDFEGLVDVYGPHIASELLGNCNNAVFLRTVSEPTAKRGAESFGAGIQIGRSQGLSISDSTTFSHNQNEEIRSLLMSSDLINLPLASKKNGVAGYYRLAGYQPTSAKEAFGIFKPDEFRLSFLKWLRQLFRKTPAKEPSPWLSAHMPRPIKDQYLQPWTAEDWKDRLGFPGEPPSWRKEPKNSGRSVSELMQEYLDSKEQPENDDGTN